MSEHSDNRFTRGRVAALISRRRTDGRAVCQPLIAAVADAAAGL